MQNLHDEQEEPQEADIDSPIPRVFDSWPEVNEDDYNSWKNETTVSPSSNQPIIITDLEVNSTEEVETDTETLDEILDQEWYPNSTILAGDSDLYLADENSKIDSENLDESSNQDYDATFEFTPAQDNIDP